MCPPDLLSADQVGLAERIHKDFLRLLGLELSQYLETPVSAGLAELQQMPLTEFLSEGEDNQLIILELKSVPALAFLSLNSAFVSRVLALLIGGPREVGSPGRTSITDIEHHILQGFFDSIVRVLRKAWGAYGAEFKLVSISNDRPDSAVSSAVSSMLVIASAIQFEGAEAHFRLAVPALLVRVVAEEIPLAAPAQGSATSRSATLEALRTATLQVEAILGGSTLKMSELLAMEPGQVLRLGNPAGSSFDCVVNGKAKFQGELIRSGDRQALQICLRVLPGTRGQS
jgi:flagellar motor switch protein FliM